jgi:molybdopterin-guanine dinucleotide biosynthesis protein A
MATASGYRVTPCADIRMTKTGGVILCGGQSSRMGRDKMHLRYHGQALFEHMRDLLWQAGVDDVYLSGADGIADIFTERGPLGGIHAAVIALTDHFTHLLFVPVDMPLLQPAQLSRLANYERDAVAMPTDTRELWEERAAMSTEGRMPREPWTTEAAMSTDGRMPHEPWTTEAAMSTDGRMPREPWMAEAALHYKNFIFPLRLRLCEQLQNTIERQLHNDDRASVKKLLAALRPERLAVMHGHEACFANANTPAEWCAATGNRL